MLTLCSDCSFSQTSVVIFGTSKRLCWSLVWANCKKTKQLDSRCEMNRAGRHWGKIKLTYHTFPVYKLGHMQQGHEASIGLCSTAHNCNIHGEYILRVDLTCCIVLESTLKFTKNGIHTEHFEAGKYHYMKQLNVLYKTLWRQRFSPLHELNHCGNQCQ